MRTRMITAAVAIAAVIVLLIYKDTIAVCLALTLLGVVAAYEIHKVSGNDNTVLYVASIVLLAVCPYISRKYIPIDFLTVVVLYFAAFAISIIHKFPRYNLEKQFLNALMTLFVSFGFVSILKILDMK